MEQDEIKYSRSEDCVNIVETYFTDFFPNFSHIKNGFYNAFWWAEFINEKECIRILFDGDAGFDVKIFIDNKEYSLWQFDKSVQKAGKSTEADIRYQLEVLKRFLLE